MTERLVYAPHFHHPTGYQRLYGVIPEPRGPDIHKARHSGIGKPGSWTHFRVASFSRLSKLNRVNFRIWMPAMARLGAGRAVLELFKEPSEAAAQLQAEAAATGLPEAGLDFFETLPKREHLTRIAGVDLAVDTIAVGGMTTALDTLYAGVPLVALQGERMNTRFGTAALSSTMGHSSLLDTTTAREYEDVVAELGPR